VSRPPRFFISPERAAAQNITVSGEDAHHIVKVLRMKPGDELLLCDGNGGEYSVRIAQVRKAEVATETLGRAVRELRRPFITLGQGLPKSDKMDWIVQKASELGVSNIVPLVTERTIVKIKDTEKRVARWRKIAREAAMQSDRPDVPHVDVVRPFGEFLRASDSGPETLRLLPWEEGTAPVKNVLRQTPCMKNIVVLIGPEGGFTKDEAGSAEGAGFKVVSLGRNILRTETAALAVLSMIGYEYY
jgi:16S rRNA (uracil1498-N3)-methyltransferase